MLNVETVIDIWFLPRGLIRLFEHNNMYWMRNTSYLLSFITITLHTCISSFRTSQLNNNSIWNIVTIGVNYSFFFCIFPQPSLNNNIKSKYFSDINALIQDNFEYRQEIGTQTSLLLSVGFEPVTSCVRGGQLDQTSTEVCNF